MSWPPEELLTGPPRPLPVTAQEAEAYEGQWEQLLGGGTYDLELPKWRFLCWATDHRGVVAHGSTNRAIARFEPRLQTDWFGRPVTRVFATPDGIWPMYFAIIDRSRYRGSLRNLFEVDAAGNRRYWFSLNEDVLADPPLTGGAVYLLPADGFEPTKGADGEVTEEWSSAFACTPLARVDVEPEDFPYRDQLASHDDQLTTHLTAVLLGVKDIEELGADDFLVVVTPAVASDAAALVDEIGVLIPETVFAFDPSRPALSVRGAGAQAAIHLIKSFIGQ